MIGHRASATRITVTVILLGITSSLACPEVWGQSTPATGSGKPRWTPPNPDPRSFEGVWLPGGYDNAPKAASSADPASAVPANSDEPPPELDDSSKPPPPPPAGDERPVSLDTAADSISGSTLECTPIQRLAGAGGGLANLWIQGADEIVMISEEDMDLRKIYLNARHPKNLKPQPNGHSIGHWEGNTLVVDSISFSNAQGVDSGEHVIERFRKDGNFLIDEATITRPGAATRHQTMRSSWRSDLHVFENVCEENFNRFQFQNGRLIDQTQ